MNRVIISQNNTKWSIKPHTFEFELNKMRKNLPTVQCLFEQVNTKRLAEGQPLAVNFKTLNNDQILEIHFQNLYFRLDSLKELPIQLEIVTARKDFEITNTKFVDMSFFELIRKVGSGTFSYVFLAEAKYDRKLFAIKVVNRVEYLKVGQLNNLINQFEIMKILRNKPFIAKLYYAFEDSNNVYLVMEYYPQGDLYQLISQQRLSQSQARIYLIQMVFAISFVHSQGYVYCDLKPQNILIDNEGYLRLGDFGFAKKVTNQIANGFGGSYEYMGPQMLQGASYTFSYDVYTLGILLFEMLMGKSPFEGAKKENILKMMENGIHFSKQIGKTQRDLIEKMTLKQPQKRIGANNILIILDHQWFKGHQEEIKLVYQKKLTNKIKLKQKITNKSEKQVEYTQSQKIGLYFNFLEPNFETSQIKFGPKLSPTK